MKAIVGWTSETQFIIDLFLLKRAATNCNGADRPVTAEIEERKCLFSTNSKPVSPSNEIEILAEGFVV